MGVIRVEHNANYTTMANYHLRDRRLSLRAVGLMSKMLSFPEDWDYTVKGLASICVEGRDAVRKALMELEAAGYLVREQTRGSHGSFAGNDYTLYEAPTAAENPPLTENPSAGEPSAAEPSAGKPLTENPPQINNLLNQSTKGTKHAPASSTSWEPEMFERFWRAYPKKGRKDKATARREWDRLKPDRELMRVMSAALDRAKTSDEWQRGIGIPYACRWLRNRRWEDEPDTAPEADAPEERLVGEQW